MERRASCKKSNFEEEINQRLLMKSNGKREKWVEEFYLNYHVPCKEETAKIREHNTQKKGGDQKQQKKAGILSKKKGTQEKLKRGDPTKILENLNYSRVGFRQPTSSGG